MKTKKYFPNGNVIKEMQTMFYDDNFENGDIVHVDLRSIFGNATVCGQAFKDEDGNIEVYIPEDKHHTEFYIKIPKNFKTY